MDTIIEFSTRLFSQFGGVIFIPIILFAVVAIGAQFMLYEKCRQPGIACLIPFWNVVVFLRIVGRPISHSLFVTAPPLIAIAISIFGGYDSVSFISLAVLAAIWGSFMIKVYIELCRSFGRNSIIDYILIILFNGLYVLNLGLSHEARYKGPVYNQNKSSETQLA